MAVLLVCLKSRENQISVFNIRFLYIIYILYFLQVYVFNIEITIYKCKMIIIIIIMSYFRLEIIVFY